MTLTEALDPAVAGPATRYVSERLQASLAETVEQLANIRFSILLAAKWQNADILSAHDRAELRDELVEFRSRYNEKIDEIAMNYGVQAAIDAKDGVEREVTIPKNMLPPLKGNNDDRLWF